MPSRSHQVLGCWSPTAAAAAGAAAVTVWVTPLTVNLLGCGPPHSQTVAVVDRCCLVELPRHLWEQHVTCMSYAQQGLASRLAAALTGLASACQGRKLLQRPELRTM